MLDQVASRTCDITTLDRRDLGKLNVLHKKKKVYRQSGL